MGIEPTGEALNATPNGFEDRGRHQACKHFQSYFQAFLEGRPSLLS